MRFLLDANLPRSALTTTLDLGFEAELARDIGMGSAKDSDIARRARETSAILITRDLDFADIRSYPPEQYPGIVVLRLPEDTSAPDVAKVLERFLSEKELLEQIDGRLAILETERVRFRPAIG